LKNVSSRVSPQSRQCLVKRSQALSSDMISVQARGVPSGTQKSDDGSSSLTIMVAALCLPVFGFILSFGGR
jgi:hypothetical protein